MTTQPPGQATPDNEHGDFPENLGPFYSAEDTAAWLGLTREALDAQADASMLLRLPLAEGGGDVYPAWQFTPERTPIPHLAEVLRILAEGFSDPWTTALWMTAPDDDWDGLSAGEWLAQGRDPEPIIAEAARDAARWRQ